MNDFLNEFKERHPEWDGADMKEFARLAEAELKAADDMIGEMRERERAMAEMFAADPRAAIFLRNWADGRDPLVELVAQFGPELRDAIDNPAMQQQMAEANTRYLERVAGEKNLDEEFRRNIAESLEMVERKSERDGIDDTTLENAWEWLRRVTDDGIHGIVSEEALDMALRAINHDRDVAEADRSGEIRGRNEAIDSHLRSLDCSDGTIASAGSGGGLRRRRNFPPLGVLDNFDNYRSVWD